MIRKVFLSNGLLMEIAGEAIKDVGPVSFARTCGIDVSYMSRIYNGHQEKISVPMADRIICKGLENPGLWQTDDRLRDLMEKSCAS